MREFKRYSNLEPPKYGNVEIPLQQHSQSLLFIDATTWPLDTVVS